MSYNQKDNRTDGPTWTECAHKSNQAKTAKGTKVMGRRTHMGFLASKLVAGALGIDNNGKVDPTATLS